MAEKKCTACQAEIEAEAIFCHFCGQVQIIISDAAKSIRILVSNSITPDSIQICGQKDSPVREFDTNHDLEYTGTPLFRTELIVCPGCSSPHVPEDKYCPHCAFDLSFIHRSSSARYCTSCGHPFDVGDHFCRNCSADITESDHTVVIPVVRTAPNSENANILFPGVVPVSQRTPMDVRLEPEEPEHIPDLNFSSTSAATIGTDRINGLDGLRSFAVLVVLAFHIWPSSVPGGFLGVDVFFVISGFLITTLLLREYNKVGHLDLLQFWKRRARRLVPALVLVVTTSIAAAWVVNHDLLVNIRRQVLGALTFITNWMEIVAGTDYFAESTQSLFTPFWSLAVEEQFYLLWPVLLTILLAVLASSALRAIVTILAAAGSAILMAMLYDPQGSATRVYYGTDTHSFGLMIGVSLAFVFDHFAHLFANRWWQNARKWMGFPALTGLIILVAVVESDAASTYHYWILFASLLSAVSVAALPGAPTQFTRLCEIPVLSWVGERSYGIYLWHWPVLLVVGSMMSSAVDKDGLNWAAAIIVICLTFLLSEASYRWIEEPIRKKGFRATWASVKAAFRPRSRIIGLPGFASAFFGLIFAGAIVGFMNAPEKSQAQLSVEAGEKMIEGQNGRFPSPDLAKVKSSISPKDAIPYSPDPAWPRDQKAPSGDKIVGFGDSVMSGAAPALYARFPGIYINARPSLQWHDAPAIVRQMIDKGTIRRVVVLNFGTNAGFKEPESAQALRNILAMLGPKTRVVLVNTVGVSYWVPSTNATLQEISREYANTIVADWYSIVQERPGLLHRDRTHPNDTGSVVYADVIADALERLGPE